MNELQPRWALDMGDIMLVPDATVRVYGEEIIMKKNNRIYCDVCGQDARQDLLAAFFDEHTNEDLCIRCRGGIAIKYDDPTAEQLIFQMTYKHNPEQN